jgi:hypothetical protein
MRFMIVKAIVTYSISGYCALPPRRGGSGWGCNFDSYMHKLTLIFWLFCLLQAQAQTISVMPPQSGGFEVQLSSSNQLATTDQFRDGRIVTDGVQVIYHAHDFSGQLRMNKNWVLGAKIPVLHIASVMSSANGLQKRRWGSNTQIGVRYLLLKPGLLDQRRFLAITSQLVLPVRVPVRNPSGLATGFTAYALELGLLGGLERQKISMEGGFAYGHRVSNYRSYMGAFGKFSVTALPNYTPSLTLNYQKAFETGTYITPMPQIESGLYPDDQSRLAVHLELRHPFSRFYGITGSVGRVLTGHHAPRGNWLGLGIWFKW